MECDFVNQKSKVKAHLKDASVPFPSECLLLKECFSLSNDVLQYVSKSSQIVCTVLTPEFMPQALRLVHDCPISGHLGIPNTLNRAQRNFYWPGMNKDVLDYARRCHLYMCFKTYRHSHPHAEQWPITQDKSFKVYMDLIGPLPTSADGRRYIAVITDNLTRYVFTAALTDKSAMSVAIALNDCIALFGCPVELITDQGTEFMNQVMKDVSQYYNIKQVNIKSYRPSANGLVESKNRVLMNILKIIVSEDPNVWSKALPIATFALNTSVNRSLKDTPHFFCLCTRSKNAIWRPCFSSETYL